jgi:hypothetical protein
MTDLSVEIAGLRLPNPVLPARLARRLDRAIRGRSPGGLGKLFVQE